MNFFSRNLLCLLWEKPDLEPFGYEKKRSLFLAFWASGYAFTLFEAFPFKGKLGIIESRVESILF